MIPAKVRTRTRPKPKLRQVIGLGLFALALSQTGCARLLAFRSPDFPASGGRPAAVPSATASREPGAPERAPVSNRDLYADMVNRQRTATDPRTDLVRADRTPKSVAPASTSGTVEPLRDTGDVGKSASAVALQAPVTLPPFSTGTGAGNTVTLANRSTPSGWKPEPARPKPAPERTELQAAEPAKGLAPPTLDSVLAECRKRLDALSTYQVKMNHQERVNSTLNPAEDVLLSIRRNPKAVRIEWATGQNQGREVLYAADANGGKMHVKMGGPLALPRISMSPDSPMARRNSRHPIYEAGFDTVIMNMEEGLTRQKANDASGGRLSYDGLETAEGLDRVSHKITRVMPAGETWVVYLDPETYLPSLVQETAANGDLLERYVFREPNLNMADLNQPGAFDPDTRWGAPKGLFSRLARAGEEEPAKSTR